jgi:phosphate transport system permease protein
MSASTVDDGNWKDGVAGSIASGPRPLEIAVDRGFRGMSLGFAWLTILLMVYILWEVGGSAFPAMKTYGLKFVTTSAWTPNRGEFGILAEIWGTLYSSILALIIGGFFGVAIAVFLTQDFLPAKLEGVFKNIIELLAAIPSVVYGLWGIFVVIPAIRPACIWLHETFGEVPVIGKLFADRLSGPGMLPAALVLAIMILPTISAISRDALSSVHPRIKEAAYGMGATRWEAILKVILPTASAGIFGAMVLGFGRALGETMALAMLVGNSQRLSVSLFSPANTLASRLANSFPEADADTTPVLMYTALVLLAITLMVNVFGTAILNRATSALTGGGDKR